MTNHNGPVLVIGATGRQGTATTHALLEKGWESRAFVRDPESERALALAAAGARLVTGDLDDEESVRAAMDGAHGVFLMLTMMSGVNISLDAVAAEIVHGKMVADLAAKTGIAHLVYSSLSGAHKGSGVEYYAAKEQIEDHIRELGLPATVLRPVLFMDNFATYNKPALVENELILSLAVAPGKPMALISIRDIGEFAALAFDRPEEFLGRTLEIAGDVLTPTEIAETLSRTAGLPYRTVRIPIAGLRAFDEQVAKMFEFFDVDSSPAPDVTTLRAAHPGLQSLETWVRATGWTL
ncbi:NmrA/HSCARG family protein [Nocardia sp. NPDC057668]|uniref:NmrA/HSCARG family protein n=1 Tax=Nocardia sp. NPDC057668 TaxID=3346202 RepID=UPI003670CB6C